MNTRDAAMERIADYLLLKGAFVQDVGLFHGKMGIAMALHLYAGKWDDEMLSEYAWDLLRQVYDGVHTDMPVGLESGLAGIGYAVTVLRKAGAVDGNLNDILGEIDAKIMEHDPRRLTDFSVRTGLGGLALYLELRQSVEPVRTFDRQYMAELQAIMKNSGTLGGCQGLMELLDSPAFPVSEYVEHPLGIDGGCAWYILKSVWP